MLYESPDLGIPVFHRATGTPLVTVRIVVNAGSCHETVPGTAHFLEHMFFKGSKLRGYEALTRALAELGDSNAYTAGDRTVFHISTVEDRAMEALAILLEMLFLPLMDPAEMEKERGVILEEFQSKEDDPIGSFFSHVQGSLFVGANGWDTLGTRESITGMTMEDLQAFRRKNYTRQNLALTIVGGHERSNLPTLINQELAKYRLVSLADGSSNVVTSTGSNFGTWANPLVSRFNHAGEQAGLVLGVPTLPNYAVLEQGLAPAVLSNMLGQGMHSLLFQRLREKKGLCYATGCTTLGNWDHKTKILWSLLAPENVDAGLSEMQAVVEELAAGQIDEDLLRVSKSNLLFSWANCTEGANGWAFEFSDEFFFAKQEGILLDHLRGLDFLLEKYHAVSEEERREKVVAAARHMLSQASIVTMNYPV